MPLDGNFSVISLFNDSIFTVQRMIRRTIRSENFYGLSSQFDDFKRDINTSIASLSFNVSTSGTRSIKLITSDIDSVLQQLQDNLESTILAPCTEGNTSWCGGGNMDSPYIITNVRQLQKVGDNIRCALYFRR